MFDQEGQELCHLGTGVHIETTVWDSASAGMEMNQDRRVLPPFEFPSLIDRHCLRPEVVHCMESPIVQEKDERLLNGFLDGAKQDNPSGDGAGRKQLALQPLQHTTSASRFSRRSSSPRALQVT